MKRALENSKWNAAKRALEIQDPVKGALENSKRDAVNRAPENSK